MTYLARGNVALSVAMTATSTLAGVVMTPFLLSLLVGTTVDVPAADMLVSLFRIVLLPVLFGVTLNALVGGFVRKLVPALAPLAVLAILAIIAIVVGLNAGRLREVALVVVLATLPALEFFSPVAALPGAIFSVWLNITGAVFAAWSTRERRGPI